MSEAVAHMRSLLALGCSWVEAVRDTAVAFDVDQFALQQQYQEIFP